MLTEEQISALVSNIQHYLESSAIPVRMHSAIVAYLRRGYCGDFLRAVLANNFVEACCRADDENAASLVQWARFVYGEMPSVTWGSAEKVRAWCRSRREAAEVAQ